MSLTYKLTSQSDEFALGAAFFDSVLLALTFWPDDLTMKGEELPHLSLEQLLMFSDQSDKVLFCTGRKISKSLVVECQILRQAITEEIKPGQTVEGLITTPRESQMDVLYGRIIKKFHQDPLIDALILKEMGGDKPETHFRNGFKWFWRIEGLGGTDTNMIGIRARRILGDEQQLGNWICHDSRKMSALPDCTFLYAGVPNGVRGTPFYALDQTNQGSEWSRHKYPTFINPLYYGDEEKRKLAKDFDGENSFAYLTQVLGEWGDETISSFPPGTIAVKRDLPPYIHEYRGDQITPYALSDTLGTVIRVNRIHCYQYAMGIDYGATSDPSVIILASRGNQEAPWLEQIRITLAGVPIPHQTSVVHYLVNFVMEGTCIGISTDSIPLADELVRKFSGTLLASRIFNANPGSATLLMNDDGSPKIDERGKPVKMRNKQYMTELLRRMMLCANMNLDGIKLWLGDDAELVEELAGTTERKTEAGFTVYYSPKRGNAWNNDPHLQSDHNRDALTYLAHAISTGILMSGDNYSEMALLESCGWAGITDQVNPWKSPWD